MTISEVLSSIKYDALQPFPRDISIDSHGTLSAYFSLTDKIGVTWEWEKPLEKQKKEVQEFVKLLTPQDHNQII